MQYGVDSEVLTDLADTIRDWKHEDRNAYFKLFDGVIAEEDMQGNYVILNKIPADSPLTADNFNLKIYWIRNNSSSTQSFQIYAYSFYPFDVTKSFSAPPDTITEVTPVWQTSHSFADIMVPSNKILLEGPRVGDELHIEITSYPLGDNPDTTYTPQEIADEVSDMRTKVLDSTVLTGDCSNLFLNGRLNDYFNLITDTRSISNANTMFSGFSGKSIHFPLNLANSNINCSNLFMNSSLIEPPIMTGQIGMSGSMFNGCQQLRNIPDGWDNNLRVYEDSSSGRGNIFNACYRLRHIPSSFLQKLYTYTTTASYIPYYQEFYYCYRLDEVLNLAVTHRKHSAAFTGNMFNNTFKSCSRLKRFTFETDNGTPYKTKWKSQVLDLSEVGYCTYENQCIDDVTGITSDLFMNDYNSYNRNKNKENNYGTRGYSRYDHNSMVETINSLPDTSEYLASAGGTNTIKFHNLQGNLTDAGGAQALTDAEIAVAAAKGWTVTIVT